MTVGAPATKGAAWVQRARKEIPSTRQPSVTLIRMYTRRARWPAGGFKALTPLEMASTPVSDAPPLANERNITNSEAPISRPVPGWPKG